METNRKLTHENIAIEIINAMDLSDELDFHNKTDQEIRQSLLELSNLFELKKQSNQFEILSKLYLEIKQNNRYKQENQKDYNDLKYIIKKFVLSETAKNIYFAQTNISIKSAKDLYGQDTQNNEKLKNFTARYNLSFNIKSVNYNHAKIREKIASVDNEQYNNLLKEKNKLENQLNKTAGGEFSGDEAKKIKLERKELRSKIENIDKEINKILNGTYISNKLKEYKKCLEYNCYNIYLPGDHLNAILKQYGYKEQTTETKICGELANFSFSNNTENKNFVGDNGENQGPYNDGKFTLSSSIKDKDNIRK
jgi:hypothetical protein